MCKPLDLYAPHTEQDGTVGTKWDSTSSIPDPEFFAESDQGENAESPLAVRDGAAGSIPQTCRNVSQGRVVHGYCSRSYCQKERSETEKCPYTNIEDVLHE